MPDEAQKPDFEKTMALLRAETEHAWVEEERERKRSAVAWTVAIAGVVVGLCWWFSTTLIFERLMDLVVSEKREWASHVDGLALPGTETVSSTGVATTADGYYVTGTFTGGYGEGNAALVHTPTPAPSPSPPPWATPVVHNSTCGYLTRVKDGKAAWHAHLHAGALLRTPRVAAAADAGAYVVGIYSGGTLTPGPGAKTLPLHNTGDDTTVLARYEPDGSLGWAESFGPAYGAAIAAIGDDVVFFGSRDQTFFLERRTPKKAEVWRRVFAATPRVNLGYNQGAATITDMAVDAAENIYLAGTVNGSINFGDGRITGAPGESAGFIASFTSGGEHRWTRRYGGNKTDANATIDQVAVGPDGALYALGTFDVLLNLGCGKLRSPDYAYNVWLARFEPDGRCVWSRVHSELGSNADLAVTRDGLLAVTVGYYYSPYAGWNSTLHKYGENGRMVWRRRLPEYVSSESGALTLDADGRLVVVGSYNGTMPINGVDVTNVSMGYDGYLVVFEDP